MTKVLVKGYSSFQNIIHKAICHVKYGGTAVWLKGNGGEGAVRKIMEGKGREVHQRNSNPSLVRIVLVREC